MSITVKEILSTFTEVELAQGQDTTLVSGPSDPKLANKDSIIFIHMDKFLNEGLSCAAGTLVISAKLKENSEIKACDKTILTSKNVVLAKALVCKKFFDTEAFSALSNKPAFVGENGSIDSSVQFGTGVQVGNNVTIEKNCIIGSNTVIESNVSIGEGTTISPLVYLGLNTQIGKACEVLPNTTLGKPGYGYATDQDKNHYRIPHYGRVVLEGRVHLGSGVSVDRGAFGDTRIGENTKIDNHCHIAHNVTIGQNSLITAGFIIAGSSSVGDNFACGGRTSVNGHVNICNDVTLMAMTVATGHITKPGIYGGYPLQPHKESLRSIATIAKLPEMRKQLKLLLK